MGDCLGKKYTEVTQDAFTYTATRSIFSMSVAEGVGFNVTFLSPIFPNDYKRHSQISSYLHVDVYSMDGQEHQVELYSDISAEWLARDTGVVAEWSADASADGKVFSHTIHRQEQLLFTEDQPDNGAIAQWGDWLWSTEVKDGMTWQSGADDDVRAQFVQNGKMTNAGDTQFRAIGDRWPVFALAHDVGKVSSSSAGSATFAIGLYQDLAIQFEGKDGIQPLAAYWTNFWDSPRAAASDFVQDYTSAADDMTTADARIHDDAVARGGEDYAAIATLAYRQAYAGVQLVGTEENPYVFLKEISSDGNIGTVDVIFPAFPVFLYDNPEFVKLMLKPLFENQEAGFYPNKWAMHDLGGRYPNATGHNDGRDERMSVEEPGNMLIMTLSYAQKANDIDFLTAHYPLMKQWNEYLVAAALAPQGDDSLSTDDFAGSHDNQTDLALKGIIGIGAMAQIANLTGNADDATNFRGIAEDYITQWQVLGINHDATPPHTTFDYADRDSHGLLYNLYGDKLLGIKLVPDSVYDMQSTFYQTIGAKYGVPLDTRWTWTKLDWELWCASISSKETMDFFHSRIRKWINETPTSSPLTDLYESEVGGYADELDSNGNRRSVTFRNRPVVGGVFALLALP